MDGFNALGEHTLGKKKKLLQHLGPFHFLPHIRGRLGDVHIVELMFNYEFDVCVCSELCYCVPQDLMPLDPLRKCHCSRWRVLPTLRNT